MATDRRRALLFGVLAVLAVGALTVAWWLTPGPDAADPGSDTDWLFPPIRGVQPPPMPPPPSTDDTDAAADSDATLEGDPLELAQALGRWLDTDLGADVDDTDGQVTDDGWPVSRPPVQWRDAVPPGEGQIVAMVVLPDGNVLAEARRDDGSVVLLRGADGPPRVLALDGVPEPALAAAKARSPALGSRGLVVLAEDAAGLSRLWTVDLEAGTASPESRDGLPPGPGVGLDALAASGPFVAATWWGRAVAVRRLGGQEGWVILDEGPAGLTGVDVLDVGGDARFVYTRSGRLLQLTSDRTVPDSIVPADTRDPVLLVDRLLWSQGGRLAGDPPVPADQLIRALPERDLVRGPTGRTAAWVGADGKVRIYPDFVALDVELERITAVAVTRDGSATVAAVAGRRGAVAELVVVRLD